MAGHPQQAEHQARCSRARGPAGRARRARRPCGWAGPLTPSMGHGHRARPGGSAGVGPHRGGLRSLRPGRPSWERQQPRTHRAAVSTSACAGAARPRPQQVSAASGSQGGQRHSPSGVIFLGGAGGGCRDPSGDTLSTPADRSRGRKRFLQEGARRNTLSSPCRGHSGMHLPPAWVLGWPLDDSLTGTVSGMGGLWWDLPITHPSSHLGLGPPRTPQSFSCVSCVSPHPAGPPCRALGRSDPREWCLAVYSLPGAHTHVLHVCVYVPVCVANSRAPHAVGAGGLRVSCLLRPRGHTTRRAQPHWEGSSRTSQAGGVSRGLGASGWGVLTEQME